MKRLMLCILLLTGCVFIKLSADIFVVDSLRYRVVSKEKMTVSVSSTYTNELDTITESVVIPPSVTYNDTTYTVTSVDRYGNESQPRILWLDQEIGDDAMYHQSRMLTCDEFFLYLDNCDIDTSQVVEIHSIEGAPLTARLTHSQGESCVIDIFLLQRGHYKAYWVTRKGDRHLLGRFYKQ